MRLLFFFFFWLLETSRKYEEITPPKVDDFCYITDNTFSKQDVVKMEADILLALQFEMGRPTVNSFIRLDCVMKPCLLLIKRIGLYGSLSSLCVCFSFLLCADGSQGLLKKISK